MDQALIRALSARGLDVVSALTEDMIQRSDRQHLQHAASIGRVLYSFNVGDYYRLHNDFMATGEHHAGLILCQQQRFSIGGQLRRLLKVAATLSPEEMSDRVEFLGSW